MLNALIGEETDIRLLKLHMCYIKVHYKLWVETIYHVQDIFIVGVQIEFIIKKHPDL